MKLAVTGFKGEAPIIANRLLPAAMASSAINAKLVSGDLDSFTDIGNPFQLAKGPVINTVWLMEGPAPEYWLQFTGTGGDLAYGVNVDVSLGTIPGDTSYRTFITGLAGGPQQTNLYYATSSLQQGAAPAGAYPYVTFPLGIDAPAQQATVVAPSQPAGPTTTYQFAQETSVNDVQIIAAGTGYAVGDAPYIEGGTLAAGFTQASGAAQVTVTSVDSTGAITGITPLSGGVYLLNQGPGSTAVAQTGLSLPAASVAVVSAMGLPASGSFTVNSNAGLQTVSYTGISGNTFTGCSGGAGTVADGAAVQAQAVLLSGGAGSGATASVTIQTCNFNGFGTYQVDNGAGYYIQWQIPGSQYWLVSSGQGDLTVAYSQTSFGLKACSLFTFQADMMDAQGASGGVPTDLVMYLCGVYSGGEAINGPILVLSDSDGTFTLYSSFGGTNGSAVSGTVVSQKSGLSLPSQAFYRVKAVCTAQTNSTTPGFSVTATVAPVSDLGKVLATLTGFIPYGGESLGVGTNHRGNGNEHNDGNDGVFENLVVTVSQPAGSVTSESTSYVYTYVTTKGSGDNAITEESGPSDPSPTITIYFSNTTNPITMAQVSGSIPPCPAGLDITNYRLYRLTQLSDGSEVYELDQTLTASTTAAVPWVDTVLDENLQDALPSSDWAPPPPNMQGILALPNGIMAGFFGNTLCLSAQNYPFAWPVDNQLPTDYPIVAIAAIDSTVLVLTTAHPYTAYGSDPSAFQMSKETANQGCASKRSVATHKRLGVVYAGGNGPCYYRGQGDLDLIRMPGGDPYFSVEQWQALNPASMIGVIHDDRYWFWYDNGAVQGGYVLDLSPAGFGLVQLDFHVTAAYVDPATDTLYFTPDFSLYPINGNVVAGALNVLSQWEGGTGSRPRTWQRQDMLLPRPACFGMARVLAEDYASVTLTVSCENGTAFSGPVSGGEPFVMAPVVGKRWSIGLSGASVINTAEIAEQVEELTQG